MGVFVNYLSDPFAGVSNVPRTILATGSNIPYPLQVNGLIVCNLGSAPIRFNLQKTRPIVPSPIPPLPQNITINYINEFLLNPYETVDVIARIGLQIFLEYDATTTPVTTDSLVCFSNGYTQIFDCEISYTELTTL